MTERADTRSLCASASEARRDQGRRLLSAGDTFVSEEMDAGDQSCAKDRCKPATGQRDRPVGAGGVPAAAAGEQARLRARERQLQAVAELGLEALGAPAFARLLDRAARSVAAALEVEIVAIEELQMKDAPDD